MRLIDADELLNEINRLEQLDTETAESFTAGGGFRAIEFNRVKDYIDAAQTVSRGWIATENALPKDKQGVVFIVNNGGYYVAELGTYHKDSEMFWGNRCCAAYKKTMVSYWAPFKG